MEILPVIDLSPFLPFSSPPDEAAKHATAKKLDEACRKVGFFYLANHGISEEICNEVIETAREFFVNAGEEEKERIRRKELTEGGDGARGWQRLGENVTMGAKDWHEAIDLYRPFNPQSPPPYNILTGPNPWPNYPQNFRPLYENYIATLLSMGSSLLRAMSLALTYDTPTPTEDLFLPSTSRSVWVLRAIFYPPLPESHSLEAGVSCGEHTDYGCTTFLLADATPGALQVKGKDGEWKTADPKSGCFVVNIGDMMERWTNGVWRSTVHRVVHKGVKDRVSVPFFLEPDFDARISPLEVCVKKTGGVRLYEEKVYGEHLLGKIGGNFYKG
ncbi:hypothetical protein RUND412_005482 [Rhizina undulata]